jgi:hypothetical protein
MHRRRIVPALLFSAACVLAPGAAAAQVPSFEYAVKVVCGNLDPSTVPGRYATAINVHNPAAAETRFRMKVAVAGAAQADFTTSFRNLRLRPGSALAITCTEIRDLTGRPVVDGFVVIQSPVEVDVVAVHTAAGSAGVSAMAVERVPPRRTQ